MRLARCPRITLPTASMCLPQRPSASPPALAATPPPRAPHQSSLRRAAALAARARPLRRRRLAPRRDRALDDLVEHLGDDFERLVARERDELAVEIRVRLAECDG